MTNACRRREDDLKAYADGELPLLRRLAVRRHLSRCASCRKELNAMQQITEDLRAPEGAAPLDSALRAKLLATADLSSPTPSSPAPPELGAGGASRRLPSLWQLAWAGAIALVVCALLISHRNYMDVVTSRPSVGMQEAHLQTIYQRMYPGGGYPGGGGQSDNGPMPMPSTLPSTSTRQVHKEATIGVEVRDVESRSDQITQLVKDAGGYIADNMLSTGDDGRKVADLTVKVPVVQFETIVGQIAKLGSVQAKSFTGEDITEKVSDADQAESVLEDEAHRADARLKSLGKKSSWRDQQAERDARVQLAQARARLDLLKKMAVLSTISVHLTEKPKPAPVPPVANGFLSGLGGTTHDAMQSLLSSLGALLALVIWILAYAPLWLPLALIGRYVYRRHQQVGMQ